MAENGVEVIHCLEIQRIDSPWYDAKLHPASRPRHGIVSPFRVPTLGKYLTSKLGSKHYKSI